MAALDGFPMVSQLTAITSDGRPSENAPFDCVAASICAGVMWLHGVKEVNQDYNPDLFKDKAYGENLHNEGTAAAAYVPYCKSLGIDLWVFKGIPGVLVREAHQQIQAGHPVIFTEPDPYVSASLGWSHVCVFYSEEPGYLVAMDPYIARPVRRTDQEWTQLLLDNEIWILEKGEAMPAPLDLSQPAVAQHFSAKDAGTWLCTQTGKIIYGEILAYYRTCGATAMHGLLDLGLPVSNEIADGPGGITRQHFERGVLRYDPEHKMDNPPGAGHVYPAHLYSGSGQDPAIAKLQAQITTLQSQPAAPQLQAALLQIAEEAASAAGKKLV